MFNFGYSIKASAILILPGLLGMIQHNNGILVLTTAILLTIGLQTLVAIPFIFSGDTKIEDYLQRSKLLGAGSSGILGRNETFDHTASLYKRTIFWAYLDQEVYENPYLFTKPLFALQLFCNAWFFFVNKGLFKGCW